ncbi:MAG: hypothetical protein IRY96_02500, partial [Burkholderiales bacterium]|nr:hypothetical protein [Burkholderiales bacterium]
DYHDEVGVPAGDLTYDPEKLADLMTKGTSRSRMAEPDPMLTLSEDAATVGIVSPYTLESRARERLKPKIVTRYGLAEGLLPGAAGGLAGVSIYELLRHLPFLEHVALPVTAGTAVISPSIISGYHGLPAMWQNPLIRAADVLARKGLTPLVGKSVGQEQ